MQWAGPKQLHISHYYIFFSSLNHIYCFHILCPGFKGFYTQQTIQYPEFDDSTVSVHGHSIELAVYSLLRSLKTFFGAYIDYLHPKSNHMLKLSKKENFCVRDTSFAHIILICNFLCYLFQEIIDMCDYAVGLSRQLSGSIIPSERKIIIYCNCLVW